MICDNCGYYNPDNYNFCKKCGKKINKKTKSNSSIDKFRKELSNINSENTKNSQINETNETSSNKKKYLLVLVIIILLLLLMVSATTIGEFIPPTNTNNTSNNNITNSTVEPVNNKINTIITLNEVNAKIGDEITYNASIKADNGENINEGIVTYSIDNNQSTAQINNGTIKIPISNLTAQKHKLNVKYGGDSLHNSSENSTSITVDKINTNITGSLTENGMKILVNLTDEHGIPLPNANISVSTENNTEIHGQTNTNGSCEIKINLTKAEHNLTIKYDGNETYNSTEVNIQSVVLNNTDSENGIISTVNDIKNGIINFSNSFSSNPGTNNSTNNNSSTDGNITINDTNTTNNEFVQNNNTTEISNNTTQPTNNTTEPNNNTQTASNKTNTKLNVEKTDSKLIINLTDKDNKTISDADITVYINNTPITAKTGADGRLEVPLNLTSGNYELEVKYDGNDTFNSADMKEKFNVN